MGIINVTPDSFSDGGRFFSPSDAITRAQEMVRLGAHIIDVGGVSTRPGSETVEPGEELRRVLPVLESLKDNLPAHALISLDSYSPRVAHEVARRGLVDIINDVYAGRCEEKIDGRQETTLSVAAKYDLGLVLMHMQGEPKTMQQSPFYENVVEEVRGFLKKHVELAMERGVKAIAVDPGIGFGKRLEDNLALLSPAGLQALVSLSTPVLVGLSRKRFLSQVDASLVEPSMRDELSKTFEYQCLANGVKIIRTHKLPSEVKQEAST